MELTMRLVRAVSQDLRFAARALRARPGFTAVVVLRAGIGLATAIFCVAQQVLLQKLPVRDTVVGVTLMARPLAAPRLNALLLVIFGAAAVALAVVGLYGVLAALVRLRTREIAVWRALGATDGAWRRWILAYVEHDARGMAHLLRSGSPTGMHRWCVRWGRALESGLHTRGGIGRTDAMAHDTFMGLGRVELPTSGSCGRLWW